MPAVHRVLKGKKNPTSSNGVSLCPKQGNPESVTEIYKSIHLFLLMNKELPAEFKPRNNLCISGTSINYTGETKFKNRNKSVYNIFTTWCINGQNVARGPEQAYGPSKSSLHHPESKTKQTHKNH